MVGIFLACSNANCYNYSFILFGEIDSKKWGAERD